jgi:hypothetical protein
MVRYELYLAVDGLLLEYLPPYSPEMNSLFFAFTAELASLGIGSGAQFIH